VGALVPELLLDARPTRRTNDVDITVIVESPEDFETLKDRLEDVGFTRTAVSHRIRHRSGGRVDILPFSDAIAAAGSLELQGIQSCPRLSSEFSTVSSTQTRMLSASSYASEDGSSSKMRTASGCSSTSSGTGEVVACDNGPSSHSRRLRSH
jgi:hypothetical protein